MNKKDEKGQDGSIDKIVFSLIFELQELKLINMKDEQIDRIAGLVGMNSVVLKKIKDNATPSYDLGGAKRCIEWLRIPIKSRKGLRKYSDLQVKYAVEVFMGRDLDLYGVIAYISERPSIIERGSLRIEMYVR